MCCSVSEHQISYSVTHATMKSLVLLLASSAALTAAEPTDVVTGKIAMISVIGPITFLASCVPWMLSGAFKNSFMDALAVGSALAGGVILGAGFSHLLPDAESAFADYFRLRGDDPDGKLANYPFAELCAVGALLALVAVDKLIVDAALESEYHVMHGHHSIHQSHHSADEIERIPHEHSPMHNHVAQALDQFRDAYVGLEEQSEKRGHEKSHLKSVGTAYLFLVALSIHSVFDGLGLGAEQTENGFFGLLVAVAGHKLLDGFALGIPIFYAQFSKFQSLFSLAFCAAMTPLGIGIGWGATNLVTNNIVAQLIKALILSISMGSFLYISLVELIPAGLASPKFLKIKLASIVFGWGIMALIALWV